jgi:C-terminal processing protease CtpA/Prc
MRIDVPKPKSSRHLVNVPRAVAHLSLPSQVGYLKINMFPGVIGIDFAKEIEAAMAGLSMCDRLVIDLRGNTGGGIGGLRVMSYLTPDKLPIGYSLTRRRAQSGYKREELRRFGRIPSTKAAIPWLIVKYGVGDKSICLYTEGLGRQKFHGKVVLLVNEHSASAAEMLAGFAAENNLAKIVGTKTAGRLLSSSAFRVGHGYILVLPTAAYLTWSGRSLEGTGITPDVEIDATYESLRAGEDVQLQKATEVVMQM